MELKAMFFIIKILLLESLSVKEIALKLDQEFNKKDFYSLKEVYKKIGILKNLGVEFLEDPRTKDSGKRFKIIKLPFEK